MAPEDIAAHLSTLTWFEREAFLRALLSNQHILFDVERVLEIEERLEAAYEEGFSHGMTP